MIRQQISRLAITRLRSPNLVLRLRDHRVLLAFLNQSSPVVDFCRKPVPRFSIRSLDALELCRFGYGSKLHTRLDASGGDKIRHFLVKFAVSERKEQNLRIANAPEPNVCSSAIGRVCCSRSNAIAIAVGGMAEIRAAFHHSRDALAWTYRIQPSRG